MDNKIFDAGMAEAERLRAEHAARLAARRQELRYAGEFRSGDIRLPNSKLAGNAPAKAGESEDWGEE